MLNQVFDISIDSSNLDLTFETVLSKHITVASSANRIGSESTLKGNSIHKNKVHSSNLNLSISQFNQL